MPDGARRLGLLAAAVMIAAGAAGLGGSPAAHAAGGGIPHYDHVAVIVMENHGFQDVIGNPAAPNLNALAERYGLATNYYGVSHPSEPNYVGLLGGGTYGVQSDDPYYVNNVDAPNLMSRLDGAGVTWKAYLQGLPHPSYQGICYPAKCNGAPDIDPLYVSKHDGIQNFTTSRTPADWARQVPVTQLDRDLASGTVPRLSYIIPDECHDQHGDPPYCLDSGNTYGGTRYDPQDQRLVATGDAYLGSLVQRITNAEFWSRGNNAVVVTYDEGDDSAGCCGAGDGSGGGQVATVVITNHGPRRATDATAYNHYSLLSTLLHNFGVACLANTCDAANVRPMTPLFAVTGSRAQPFDALPVPDEPVPTPPQTEPVSMTSSTASSGGWSVVPSPLNGTGDTSFGAVTGDGSGGLWAAGNYLPDTPASNQDATLAFTAHRTASGTWTVPQTPDSGPNFNTLFGIAASGGKAWAVGVHLDAGFRQRALVEAWDGTRWSVVDVPQPGSGGDVLYSASATSATDVWAAGIQQDAGGVFHGLVEHFDGGAWSVVATPGPGTTGNQLFGITALSRSDVWAVGQRNDAAGDAALVEHWNGRGWSVVATPSTGAASSALYSVSAAPGGVVAVGQTEDQSSGSQPLADQLSDGVWTAQQPAGTSRFTALWSVTGAPDGIWAVGGGTDASGTERTVVLRGAGGTWTVVPAPSPGAGDDVLGGVTTVGSDVFAVGTNKDNSPRQTLVEEHAAA